MIVHKRQLTIENPERVVLTGLPFHAGLRGHAQTELDALFKTTQALPQADTISEEEITAEIEAYRAGQRGS